MRYPRVSIQSLVFVAPLALSAGAAQAQTTAVGPYYATPSWDQQIACSSPSNCPRFVVLSNWNSEAVLDRETGLVWRRDADLFGQTTNYSAALTGCATDLTGGRMGWRLPSLHELFSLIDHRSLSEPGLPAGHPFRNIAVDDSAFYWSGTTDAFNSQDFSLAMRFHIPTVFSGPKGDSRGRTWCVRGGGPISSQ